MLGSLATSVSAVIRPFFGHVVGKNPLSGKTDVILPSTRLICKLAAITLAFQATFRHSSEPKLPGRSVVFDPVKHRPATGVTEPA
jgi:hypothetical protein